MSGIKRCPEALSDQNMHISQFLLTLVIILVAMNNVFWSQLAHVWIWDVIVFNDL